MRPIGAGGVTSRKKIDAAIHMAKAGAATLKRIRGAVRDPRASVIDMTRASPPASSAPAGGPNSRAAAIVNVSDRDRLMGNPGIRIVAHPVRKVISARRYHAGGNGSETSRIAENTRTVPPMTMTAPR